MKGLVPLAIAAVLTTTGCGGGEASNTQAAVAVASDTIIRHVSTKDTIIKHVTAGARDTIIKHAAPDCCNTTPRPPDCPPLVMLSDTIIRQQ